MAASRAARAVFSALPPRMREVISAGRSALRRQPFVDRSPWSARVQPVPQPSLEMSLLQTCEWKLPFDKAERLLGYSPRITFAEGMRRTIAWMEFAGYPVTTRREA